MSREKLQKLFVMGQNYWYYGNHDFESHGKKAEKVREQADALINELCTEDHVLLPSEPTEAMIYRGGMVIRNARRDTPNKCCDEIALDAYRAMLKEAGNG